VTAPNKVSPDSARDYAAREAAAPQLAEFASGSGGIYIGTGVLEKQSILTLDPAHGLRVNGRDGFATEWAKAGQLALIILPSP
jgi:hypothetical protein